LKDINIMLNENLNVDIKDYFKLKEEDKEYVTQFLVQTYSRSLDIEPQLIHMYLDTISKVITKSVEQESYEVADIMDRSYKALDKKYGYYKYFPKED